MTGDYADPSVVVDDKAHLATNPMSDRHNVVVQPASEEAVPLSHGSNPNSSAAGRRREDDQNLVVQASGFNANFSNQAGASEEMSGPLTGQPHVAGVVQQEAFVVQPEFGQGADLRADPTELAPTLGSLNEGGVGYDRGVRIVEIAEPGYYIGQEKAENGPLRVGGQDAGGGHDNVPITVEPQATGFSPTGGTRDVQASDELSPPLRVGSGVGIPSGPAVAIQGEPTPVRLSGRDALERRDRRGNAGYRHWGAG